MTTRRALTTFLIWVALALATVAGLWVYFGKYYVAPGATGPDPALGARLATEFFGAWAMEEALSLDNLFMFYFIFSVFQTPTEARVRVLRWGIIGVILMRGAIILGGTTLLTHFKPLLYVFAVFLLWAAFKIFFFHEDEEQDEDARQAKLEQNWLVRLASKVMKFEKRYVGDRFFIEVDGKRRATLLLLVVLVVEGTDLPFAFDSLPAALAISQNFWIVMISNLMAVMGLRSIYFLIQNMRERFSHMQQGIGILLAFAGLKIILANFGHVVNSTVGLVYADIAKKISPDYGVHLPLWVSVGFIAAVITLTIAYTLFRTRGQTGKPA
jgi:tellurite resistance protein TerC